MTSRCLRIFFCFFRGVELIFAHHSRGMDDTRLLSPWNGRRRSIVFLFFFDFRKFHFFGFYYHVCGRVLIFSFPMLSHKSSTPESSSFLLERFQISSKFSLFPKSSSLFSSSWISWTLVYIASASL